MRQVGCRAGWGHISSGTALNCVRGFPLATEPGGGQLHSVPRGALTLDCHLLVWCFARRSDDDCVYVLTQPRAQDVFLHSLT